MEKNYMRIKIMDKHFNNMKKSWHIYVIINLLISTYALAQQKTELAPAPPMGWNSSFLIFYE